MRTKKFFKSNQGVARLKYLSGNDKLVYSIIVDHIGQNKDGYPGTRLLATESGLCRQTVIDAIAQLERAGPEGEPPLLNVYRSPRRRNRYSIPPESGHISRPDDTLGKADNLATSLDQAGLEPSPELATSLDRNQTDQGTKQQHKAVAAPSSTLEEETAKAVAQEKTQKLNSLGIHDPKNQEISEDPSVSLEDISHVVTHVDATPKKTRKDRPARIISELYYFKKKVLTATPKDYITYQQELDDKRRSEEDAAQEIKLAQDKVSLQTFDKLKEAKKEAFYAEVQAQSTVKMSPGPQLERMAARAYSDSLVVADQTMPVPEGKSSIAAIP